MFPPIDISSADELHAAGACAGAWVEDGTVVHRFWPCIQPTSPSYAVAGAVRALMMDHEIIDPSMAMMAFIHVRTSLHPYVCGAAIRYQWMGGGLDTAPETLVDLFRFGHSTGSLMTSAEYRRLASLPDLVDVWRGRMYNDLDGELRPSWTLDSDVANQYTYGPGQPRGWILHAQIPRDRIFALFEERSESEVVVDPRALRILNRKRGTATSFPVAATERGW